MARQRREVFPGMPHHVTQRGGRRQNVFFEHADYLFYLDCLRKFAVKCDVSVLAYCLMTNHVHHILVPSSPDGLHKLFKCIHTKYALRVNKRYSWKGHLWQARYFSSPLDERYLQAATRYVELNPVRAHLAEQPEHYPWSSARSRILDEPDDILDRSSHWAASLPDHKEWKKFLVHEVEKENETIRAMNRRNLPCGSDHFINELECRSGQPLKPRRRGRPKKQ